MSAPPPHAARPNDHIALTRFAGTPVSRSAAISYIEIFCFLGALPATLQRRERDGSWMRRASRSAPAGRPSRSSASVSGMLCLLPQPKSQCAPCRSGRNGQERSQQRSPNQICPSAFHGLAAFFARLDPPLLSVFPPRHGPLPLLDRHVRVPNAADLLEELPLGPFASPSGASWT